ELEAARAALPREHVAEDLDRLAYARERLVERDLVPTLDDHVRGRADAEAEAPPGGVLQRGGMLREHRGAARERVHDTGPESQALGPGGGQGKRREAVRARGLTGPEVVEADCLGALYQGLVLAERHAREGKRQRPSDRWGHALRPSHRRLLHE